jgi:hypothetical protein
VTSAYISQAPNNTTVITAPYPQASNGTAVGTVTLTANNTAVSTAPISLSPNANATATVSPGQNNTANATTTISPGENNTATAVSITPLQRSTSSLIKIRDYQYPPAQTTPPHQQRIATKPLSEAMAHSWHGIRFDVATPTPPSAQ